MVKRISAGLVMYDRINEKWHVLIAHPGGPFFDKKDKGYWSIPKGEVDGDEDRLVCAIREFEEETGHTPRKCNFHDLGSITQKGGKTVFAWGFRGEWKASQFKSNYFTMEWPPKSGRIHSFPEIDRAEMMPLEKARKYIKATQVPLLDKLESLLNDQG